MQYARERFGAVARPWVRALPCDLDHIEHDRIQLANGINLHCSILAQRLTKVRAHALVIIAASAGPEVVAEINQCWETEKPDSSYFLDALSSCVVERMVLSSGIHLCDWAEPLGMAVIPHYSPGYTGWALSDQVLLLDFLKTQQTLGGPLDALESGMLNPRKSQLAVFGLTRYPELLDREPDLCPCVDCSFSPCAYRRMPQRKAEERSVPQALKAMGEPVEALLADITGDSVVAQYAYDYPAKALKRWARECLSLVSQDDGTTLARFRYNGSTCSSQGIPITFEFNVRLGQRTEGYPILHSTCGPPDGDESYRNACAHMMDAEASKERLQTYQPLLGELLDEVLTWEPEFKMSGCACTREDLAHKWRVALQAIHFGIRSREAASR